MPVGKGNLGEGVGVTLNELRARGVPEKNEKMLSLVIHLIKDCTIVECTIVECPIAIYDDQFNT